MRLAENATKSAEARVG